MTITKTKKTKQKFEELKQDITKLSQNLFHETQELKPLATVQPIEDVIDIEIEIQSLGKAKEHTDQFLFCSRCGLLVDHLYQMDTCKSCLTLDFRRLIHIIDSVRK